MTWSLKNARNKYHAKSTIYDGSYYHSKAEAAYAQELDLRIKAKDIKSWRRQVPIELKIGEFPICKYYVDFEIIHKNGDLELIEIKGMETEVWRLKRKILEATFLKENPQYIYTVIKV